MKAHGLAGAVRGKVKRTTIVGDPAAERARDLVGRNVAPTAPDRLWVADLTYVSTWSGWVYVAFVTDAARTLPFEDSINSSIFGTNESITFDRATGAITGTPASRAATYRRTVFGSTPANAAAECAHPVTSNASRISMISLSDFFTVPPDGSLVRGQRPRAFRRRDT